MSPEVIVAIISGIVTVTVIIINARLSNKEMVAKLDKDQTVMDTKLEELTREVRRLNDFATRVPLVEQSVKQLSERVNRLEQKGE